MIVPHLWYDKDAKAAAELYVRAFPDSRIIDTYVLRGTPDGNAEVATMDIMGTKIVAFAAGPMFKVNPSISFFTLFDTKEQLDQTWQALEQGGQALMPKDRYPWSEHYGWIQDRYGVSWQLMLDDQTVQRPKLMPCLMFVGKNYGRAEEAIDHWTGIFDHSERGRTDRHDDGNLLFADFKLDDQWFIAMDSQPHEFQFNEAASLLVECDTQQEMDRYTNALSADPDAEVCGWLKDKFGVSGRSPQKSSSPCSRTAPTTRPSA